MIHSGLYILPEYRPSTPINSIFDGSDPVTPLGPETRRVLPPEHTKRGQAENVLKMIEQAVKNVQDAEQ